MSSRQELTMKFLTPILLSFQVVAVAQQPASTAIQPSTNAVQPSANTAAKAAPTQADRSVQAERSKAPADYVLGPGDQIVVQVLNAEEISNKPLLVDMSGFIRLAVVGRVHVGGLTVSQVESDLAEKLKGYLLHPD